MARHAARVGTQEDRQVALARAIDALRARFGAQIIRLARDLAALPALPDRLPLSTGSLGLDLLTGGLPRGGLTEYAGSDGSGRESLAAAAAARAQAAGGLVLLVDAGGTADPEALSAAGLDLQTLPVACPATTAQAWTMLDAICRCGALDLVLVASFSGLLALPGAEFAQGPARRLARLTLALRGRRTAVLLVNTPVSGRGWRTVEERALAPVATLRVALAPRGACIGPHGDVVGLHATAQVINYHGMSLGTEVDLLIGAAGPDRALELLRLAQRAGCVEETALGLVSCGQVLGRTEARAAGTLRRDGRLARLLEEHVRAAWPTPVARPWIAGA